MSILTDEERNLAHLVAVPREVVDRVLNDPKLRLDPFEQHNVRVVLEPLLEEAVYAGVDLPEELVDTYTRRIVKVLGHYRKRN